MATAGVQKVLLKLESQLQAGNYYEAHEMFKTVFQRHRSRKNYADSYQLAEEGAKLQLRQGQLNCGVELALMLVDAYEADGVAPASPEAGQRVMEVLDAFPVRHLADGGPDPPVEEYGRVVGAAAKWARKGEAWELAAQLEGRLARYLSACLGWQGLGAATRHYIRAGDAPAFAAALADAAAHGQRSEEDLFLVRAALTTAAASSARPGEQVEAARELLGAYAAAAGHAPPPTPLLSFASLFLEALARREPQLADLLCQRYKPSLDRDPTLWQLVEQCRGAVFRSASGGPPGGLFDLLGALAGGA